MTYYEPDFFFVFRLSKEANFGEIERNMYNLDLVAGKKTVVSESIPTNLI